MFALNKVVSEQDQTRQRVKRLVLSCMEVGNFAVARTTMAEFKAVDEDGYNQLNADVVASFNTSL